jgi:hypothetical protein
MFALVENQQITKFYSGNKGVTLGDVQYPKSIFTLWSEAERNAIGIFEVIVDTTNKKDEQWYINTNISYGVESNKAVGSYGAATPKLLEDRNEINEDGSPMLDADGNQVVTKGLKSQKKDIIKQQAAGILADTDWYITRKADAGTAVPSAVTTHRAAVRTKSNEMETAIDNASDVDALATLYKYVNTGTEENPVMERPLGEFPTLES